MGEAVEFPTNSATGQGPGVVVIQEWSGLVDHISQPVRDRAAAFLRSRLGWGGEDISHL